MLIPFVTFQKILKKAKALLPSSRKCAINEIAKLSISHKRSNSISINKIAHILARSGKVKRFQNIKLLFSLAGIIRPLNFMNQLELRYALRVARLAGNRSRKIKKIIPDARVFRETIKSLYYQDKGKMALILILMLSSGRRFIDICRLDSSKIRWIGDFLYKASLPYDKKSDSEITFKIDFSAIPISFRPSDLSSIDLCFRAELATSIFPFEHCKDKNLSRSLKFHPHSIRSLVAIYLTKEGLSDEQIMVVAGWKDLRSLQLYRRISRSDILGESLEQLIWRANK